MCIRTVASLKRIKSANTTDDLGQNYPI